MKTFYFNLSSSPITVPDGTIIPPHATPARLVVTASRSDASRPIAHARVEIEGLPGVGSNTIFIVDREVALFAPRYDLAWIEGDTLVIKARATRAAVAS